MGHEAWSILSFGKRKCASGLLGQLGSQFTRSNHLPVMELGTAGFEGESQKSTNKRTPIMAPVFTNRDL